MVIKFKYGFNYKGFIFGWHEKELYRLPSKSGFRMYSFKKLNPITVGNRPGYCCKKNKFSIQQLRDLTMLFSEPKEISIIKDADCPF